MLEYFVDTYSDLCVLWETEHEWTHFVIVRESSPPLVTVYPQNLPIQLVIAPVDDESKRNRALWHNM